MPMSTRWSATNGKEKARPRETSARDRFQPPRTPSGPKSTATAGLGKEIPTQKSIERPVCGNKHQRGRRGKQRGAVLCGPSGTARFSSVGCGERPYLVIEHPTRKPGLRRRRLYPNICAARGRPPFCLPWPECALVCVHAMLQFVCMNRSIRWTWPGVNKLPSIDRLIHQSQSSGSLPWNRQKTKASKQ